MKSKDDKQPLRSIPSVDEVLGTPEIAALREAHPRFPWTHFVRGITGEVRKGKHGPVEGARDDVRALVVRTIESRVSELRSGGTRRVINGTGVILNTNLGRAVLGTAVIDAVRDAMGRYVNLEVDLETGKRSHRAQTLEELVCLLAQADGALVVNNNAAAVWLVVNTFSPPGRVVVSRGELVEIGGSFRLPDILARAAGEVIEVGTTNRTYAADYAKVAKSGDVLLKVHRSNYDIRGFTHEADIAELVAVGREKRCQVVYDLGSGCFYDFEARGITGEKRVGEVLRTGVDCVTMSGDKLLGGVQAGIIVGKAGVVAKLKQNPLRRALRIDKATIAGLQALARVYLFHPSPESSVPTLRLTLEEIERLKARAQRIADAVARRRAVGGVRVVEDPATIGGGSFACQDIPSIAVAVGCASQTGAVALCRKLRMMEVPILSRIKGDEVRVNMRSILPDEDDEVARALGELLGNS